MGAGPHPPPQLSHMTPCTSNRFQDPQRSRQNDTARQRKVGQRHRNVKLRTRQHASTLELEIESELAHLPQLGVQSEHARLAHLCVQLLGLKRGPGRDVHRVHLCRKQRRACCEYGRSNSAHVCPSAPGGFVPRCTALMRRWGGAVEIFVMCMLFVCECMRVGVRVRACLRPRPSEGVRVGIPSLLRSWLACVCVRVFLCVRACVYMRVRASLTLSTAGSVQ